MSDKNKAYGVLMTAKTQALIGITIGAIGGAAAYFRVGLPQHHYPIGMLVPFMLVGILYGFGYIFSGPVLKKWVSWAIGASCSVITFSILLQLFTRRGLFGGLFVAIFLLAGSVGLAYIPGIFIGIRRLREKEEVATS